MCASVGYKRECVWVHWCVCACVQSSACAFGDTIANVCVFAHLQTFRKHHQMLKFCFGRKISVSRLFFVKAKLSNNFPAFTFSGPNLILPNFLFA